MVSAIAPNAKELEKLESEAREAKLGLWLDRDPGLGFSSVVTEGLHGQPDIREREFHPAWLGDRTERRSWLHYNMWGSRCSEQLGSLLRIWILQPLVLLPRHEF